jgi:hypothetical protein
MRINGSTLVNAVGAAFVLALSESAVLSTIFDVIIEKEIVGPPFWAILGY